MPVKQAKVEGPFPTIRAVPLVATICRYQTAPALFLIRKSVKIDDGAFLSTLVINTVRTKHGRCVDSKRLAVKRW